MKHQDNEPDHHYRPSDARRYGVAEAAILYNLRFWLNKNMANKTNIYDGRVWTYNSYKAFAELFTYLSIPQIKRLLTKLENEGIVISGNYNAHKRDRTKWYTINEPQFIMSNAGDESVPDNERNRPPQETESSHTRDEIVPPLPYSKPDSKPDVNTNKRRSVFVEKAKQLQDTVDLWNQTYGTDVRITDKKRQQLNARLKNFTIEEIHKAIRNRAENEWLKGDGHAHRGNWDSLFRNDERVEKYLNMKTKKEPEKAKPNYGYNMPREYWT